MSDTPKGAGVNCEWFLSELEDSPLDRISIQELLSAMTEGARAHAASCVECAQTLEDFSEIRVLLAPMEKTLPEPGPWFTRRVMNAIGAQEAEMEERVNGFWIGVRRLAPRLVAFATLLLMIGGTWAFQEQRAHRGSQQSSPGVEGIFESSPNIPANDDIVASVNEVNQR
jgi:hypothetical protein